MKLVDEDVARNSLIRKIVGVRFRLLLKDKGAVLFLEAAEQLREHLRCCETGHDTLQ